jgi:hypothetical protein
LSDLAQPSKLSVTKNPRNTAYRKKSQRRQESVTEEVGSKESDFQAPHATEESPSKKKKTKRKERKGAKVREREVDAVLRAREANFTALEEETMGKRNW